jgi:hypothetical protein
MAYWNLGIEYRNLLKYPDYEEYLYQYTISKPSNGLEAILRTIDDAVRLRQLNKLKRTGYIWDVIKNNQNDKDCAELFDVIFHYLEDGENLDRYYDSEMFLKELFIFSPGAFCKALFTGGFNTKGWFKECWESIDNNRVLEWISHECPHYLLSRTVQHVYLLAPHLKNKILNVFYKRWKSIKEYHLSDSIYEAYDLKRILKIDREFALRLWHEIDTNELVDSMLKECRISPEDINTVLTLDPTIKNMLYTAIHTGLLMDNIEDRYEADKLSKILYDVCRFDKTLGRDIWKKINKDKLIIKLLQCSPGIFFNSLGLMLSSDEKAGKDFLKNHIPTECLKSRFCSIDSISFVRRFMSSVRTICPKIMKRLWDDYRY